MAQDKFEVLDKLQLLMNNHILKKPTQSTEVSIVGANTILGDKETITKTPSIYDAIICQEGSEVYEMESKVYNTT